MLVGLQRLGQAVVIGQGASDGQFVIFKIGSRIEKFLLQGLAVTLRACPRPRLPRLYDFRTVGVILEAAVVFLEIVKYNLPLVIDQRHPQAGYAVRLHIVAQRLFVSLAHVLDGVCHPRVIVLQSHVQHLYLVLLFPRLLEDDERDGKKQEHRHDADV